MNDMLIDMQTFDPSATSPLLRAGFVVLSAMLAMFWVWAWWRTSPTPRKRGAGAAVVVAVWLAVPALLSGLPVMHDFATFPPPLVRVFVVVFVAVFVFAFSPLGKRMARAFPLWLLVGFQSFRVAVELLLHRAYNEGWIGVQMTYLGRNFDIFSGLSALVLGVVLYRKALPKLVLWIWNVVGLALLLNIVAIAVLSMPTSHRVFVDGPANVFVGYMPFIWLPTVLVASALVGHLLLSRRLLMALKA